MALIRSATLILGCSSLGVFLAFVRCRCSSTTPIRTTSSGKFWACCGMLTCPTNLIPHVAPQPFSADWASGTFTPVATGKEVSIVPFATQRSMILRHSPNGVCICRPLPTTAEKAGAITGTQPPWVCPCTNCLRRAPPTQAGAWSANSAHGAKY